MAEISLELVRKRAEHNEGLVTTLEELSLHQEELLCINDFLNRNCRHLNKADVFALALSLRNALEPETQEDVAAGAVDTFIEQRSKATPGAPTRRALKYLKPSFDRWLSHDSEERRTTSRAARTRSRYATPRMFEPQK